MDTTCLPHRTRWQLFVIASVITLLAVPWASSGATANVAVDLDSELKDDGTIVASGHMRIEGQETNLVRLFIDSSQDSPQIGFMGTGDGDKNVTQDEVDAYIEKAKSTGAIALLFQAALIEVTLDDRARTPDLKDVDLKGATGLVISQGPVDSYFNISFKFPMAQGDRHTVRLKIGLPNVTADIKFKCPKDYEITSVKGLAEKQIRNDKARGSTVEGRTDGKMSDIIITMSKGDIMCLVLIVIGAMVGVVTVYLVFRRLRRSRKEKDALKRLEYTNVGDTDGVKGEAGKTSKKAVPAGGKDRTFGKRYFEEEDGGKKPQARMGGKDDGTGKKKDDGKGDWPGSVEKDR